MYIQSMEQKHKRELLLIGLGLVVALIVGVLVHETALMAHEQCAPNCNWKGVFA